MKYVIGFAYILFSFSGCIETSTLEQASSGGSEDDSGVELQFKSGASTLSMEEPVPILVGTLGVAGYYYRPGAASQMGTQNLSQPTPWVSSDWSRWQMVFPNSEGARDFIIPKNGKIDLEDRADGHLYDDVSAEFVRDVGYFRMDVISVDGAFSLINDDNSVCGYGYLAHKTPADFPQLDFMTNCRLARMLRSSYDSSYLLGRRLLFIRKDWFHNPVQIYMHSNVGSQVQCYTSDVPLSPFQAEILDSLLSDIYGTEWDPGLYRASCSQIPQQVVSIVPQTDDVALVQLSEKMLPEIEGSTRNGHAIPNSNQKTKGKKIKLAVRFNLVPSLFVDFNSFNDSNATSDIYINRDSNGSLWGVSVGFDIKKVAKGL